MGLNIVVNLQLNAARYLLGDNTHNLEEPGISPDDFSNLKVFRIYLVKKDATLSSGRSVKPSLLRCSNNGHLEYFQSGGGVEEAGKKKRKTPAKWVPVKPETLNGHEFRTIYHYSTEIKQYGTVVWPAIRKFFGLEDRRLTRVLERRRRLSKKSKAIEDRMVVLSAILELKDQGKDPITSYAVGIHLYGLDYIYLDDNVSRSIQNCISALVNTNDVSATSGNGYLPTDQAFNTLLEWQKDEDIERRVSRQQRWMVGLTAILALSALGDLVVAWLS